MVATKKRIVLYNPNMTEPLGGFPPALEHLPLPLLSIAAWPDRDGYEVVLIDANLLGMERAQRCAVEACQGALLFGTTGILGYQVADAYRCAKAVRNAHPALPMFIGGWWASVAAEMELETGLYDAVCLGQGELTFRDLVQSVECGTALEQVPGLALWRDGALVRTAHRSIAGWDQLLNPAWHLIDLAPYRDAQLSAHSEREASRSIRPPGFNDKPHWNITYFSSFGCPEPCTFCCSPEVTGMRWKAMPAARMLDDLHALHERWRFDAVRFYDANFGVAEKRVVEFCDGMIERGTPFAWATMVQAFSVLRWKKQTLDRLRPAGLYHMLIGGETGDAEMLRAVAKHTKQDENYRSAVEMNARGIPTLMTYILGYPGESTQAMMNTIDECRRIAADCPSVRPVAWPFKPIPGTALYPQALEKGFQAPTTLEGWGNQTGEYHLWETQSWPGQIPREVLRARQTFEHYYTLSMGLVRGRIGWWERRAKRRLSSGDFRFGRAEARVFTLCDRLARSVGAVRRGPIRSGIQTSQPSPGGAGVSTPMG
jgi:radical SAM superfamily enzyme YgiQ (UPF0313 family)